MSGAADNLTPQLFSQPPPRAFEASENITSLNYYPRPARNYFGPALFSYSRAVAGADHKASNLQPPASRVASDFLSANLITIILASRRENFTNRHFVNYADQFRIMELPNHQLIEFGGQNLSNDSIQNTGSEIEFESLWILAVKTAVAFIGELRISSCFKCYL